MVIAGNGMNNKYIIILLIELNIRLKSKSNNIQKSKQDADNTIKKSHLKIRQHN